MRPFLPTISPAAPSSQESQRSLCLSRYCRPGGRGTGVKSAKNILLISFPAPGPDVLTVIQSPTTNNFLNLTHSPMIFMKSWKPEFMGWPVRGFTMAISKQSPYLSGQPWPHCVSRRYALPYNPGGNPGPAAVHIRPRIHAPSSRDNHAKRENAHILKIYIATFGSGRGEIIGAFRCSIELRITYFIYRVKKYFHEYINQY